MSSIRQYGRRQGGWEEFERLTVDSGITYRFRRAAFSRSSKSRLLTELETPGGRRGVRGSLTAKVFGTTQTGFCPGIAHPRWTHEANHAGQVQPFEQRVSLRSIPFGAWRRIVLLRPAELALESFSKVALPNLMPNRFGGLAWKSGTKSSAQDERLRGCVRNDGPAGGAELSERPTSHGPAWG